VTPGPIYVYGVLAAPDAAAAEAAGLGVAGGAVSVLPLGDLAALVSPASEAPVARSRRNLLAHTAVLERAMAHTTVLPLRFGTVAPDAAALAHCVTAHQAAFAQAMRGIDGRVELGLKASWRSGLLFADIVERDPALRQLRNMLRARPQGETYYERIELGRRVEVAIAQRRTDEAALIMAELAPLAEREADMKTHDDDMILNRAFLVPRAAEAAFDAAVARIAERFAGRVEFRYVGPVPPFNFVSLHAGWLTPGRAA
jgi:hypothetical protein